MSVNFQSARFLTSAATLAQCPPDVGAEVAFCGRSNAGKSSAINALTRQKNLARTGKTPGRTRLINFFAISDTGKLVDLPGYGYARVAISVRDHWRQHLDEYLRARASLRGMVLLADIRHPIREFDELMIEWSSGANLPIHILLTKADKLKRGAQQSALRRLEQGLPGQATAQVFSATKKLGLDTLEATLSGWMAGEN